MAQTISLAYYTAAKIRCTNCGSEYMFSSNVEDTTIEVCGNCHPFYTGNDTILDATGRIERFQQRMSMIRDSGSSTKKAKTRRIRQTLADLDETESTQEVAATPKKEESKKPKESAPQATTPDSVEQVPSDNNVSQFETKASQEEVSTTPKSEND